MLLGVRAEPRLSEAYKKVKLGDGGGRRTIPSTADWRSESTITLINLSRKQGLVGWYLGEGRFEVHHGRRSNHPLR